jgi:hypothetical protein
MASAPCYLYAPGKTPGGDHDDYAKPLLAFISAHPDSNWNATLYLAAASPEPMRSIRRRRESAGHSDCLNSSMPSRKQRSQNPAKCAILHLTLAVLAERIPLCTSEAV